MAFCMEKLVSVEAATICALQSAVLAVTQPLAGQRCGFAGSPQDTFGVTDLNGNQYGAPQGHDLSASVGWRARRNARRISDPSTASGFEQEYQRKPNDQSWQRSREALGSRSIPQTSTSQEILLNNSSTNPAGGARGPANGSSRESRGTLSLAARQRPRNTGVNSVPWDARIEGLWRWEKKRESTSLREFKLLVQNLDKVKVGTLAMYAKSSGLEVIKLPRAIAKRWIDDTKTTGTKPGAPNAGDLVFLSDSTLCFTDVEPAVLITAATPLSRESKMYSFLPFTIACEVVNAACERLLRGGALPERVSPSAVYRCTRRHNHYYAFLPIKAQPDVNMDAVCRQGGVFSSISSLADVINVLRERIMSSDLLCFDFLGKELNQKNAKKFLQSRLKDAGFDKELAEELCNMVRSDGNIRYSGFWLAQLRDTEQVKTVSFVKVHGSLMTTWKNVRSRGQDKNIDYAMQLLEDLKRLVNVPREGTVASLLQAWELSQTFLIRHEARGFNAVCCRR